jgi:hypothetical protein
VRARELAIFLDGHRPERRTEIEHRLKFARPTRASREPRAASLRSFDVQPMSLSLQFRLLMFSRWVNRHQQAAIEYAAHQCFAGSPIVSAHGGG